MPGWALCTIGITVVLSILGLGIYAVSSGSKYGQPITGLNESSGRTTTREASVKPPEVPLNIGSMRLSAEYEANEVAADLRYRGRLLSVTGVVGSITKDFCDIPYVSLSGTNWLSDVSCSFNKEDQPVLAMLHKGDQITVIGRCTGKWVTTVTLKDCRIPGMESSSSSNSGGLGDGLNDQVSSYVESLVGTYSNKVFDGPMKNALQSLFSNRFEEFRESITSSLPLRMEGQYLIGEGCPTYECGGDGSIFAVSKKPFKIYALMVKDRNLTTWGVTNTDELPWPLKKWIVIRALPPHGRHDRYDG